jgi:hypothetical protein
MSIAMASTEAICSPESREKQAMALLVSRSSNACIIRGCVVRERRNCFEMKL